jgi:hypothetical protein
MGERTNIIPLDTKRLFIPDLPSVETKLLELLAERKEIQENFLARRERIKNR